jgi:phage terminase large subunit
MTEKRIVLPYRPRAAFLPYHETNKRFRLLLAHRRAGKSTSIVSELGRSAVTCALPYPRVALIAPFRNQAKRELWEPAKRALAPMMAGEPNESELTIRLLNGAKVELHGADNQDALRGGYFDDVACDEYGDMPPGFFEKVILPRLADRRGRATVSGTPKGPNHFKDRAEQAESDADWFFLRLRASETGIIPADELDLLRRNMPAEDFAQEFELDFNSAIKGAYYGALIADAEREHRITAVPVDPSVRVHTSWDLGIGDSTAVWFWQVCGREYHLIDYYEANGEALPHYVRVLQQRGYLYGAHYLPHDAQARELGTGRTRVETLAALGLEATVVPALNLEDQINAVRQILPMCWFDQGKTAEGRKALINYRSSWDETRKVFSSKPRHDWASHGASAFAQFCVGYEPAVAARNSAPSPLPSGAHAWMA